MDHAETTVVNQKFDTVLKERGNEQLWLNQCWLINKLDEVHSYLCPGQFGTWQQRVEQVVDAAKLIAAQRTLENGR